MLDFQVPRISSEAVDDNRGSFTIEPLDRGFGYTFGNSLRRVLLSSLSGAAVTSVRIEGVAHEFSTISGVKEDVTDIVLNLKGVVCRMHSDASEVEAPLVVTGPGEITAKDIDLPSGRGEQVLRPADRRDPDRLDLLARPPRRLRRRAGPCRAEDGLRQADPGHRDGRFDRPPGGTPRGGRAADLPAGHLHRRRPHPGAPGNPRRPAGRPRPGGSRRCPGGTAGRGVGHPDRGARAGRPLLQLPQAGRYPDGRGPDLKVRGRAERDPQLRQKVDRRGHRNAPRTRPEPPRGLRKLDGRRETASSAACTPKGYVLVSLAPRTS